MNILGKSTLDEDSINWTAMQYLNFYRVFIGVLLVIFASIDKLPQSFESLEKLFFSVVCYLYLSIALFFIFLIKRHYFNFDFQVILGFIIDIIALNLLMYLSYGLDSGFGLLIIIAVAGGSILSTRRTAIFFATVASLIVLGCESYLYLFSYSKLANYPHAGMLGITFFITALIGNWLAIRVRDTEALAKQQEREIDDLAELNEHVVQRMQSGIMVLDKNKSVILLNESAKQFLRLSEKKHNEISSFVKEYIEPKVNKWQQEKSPSNIIVKLPGIPELRISFVNISVDNNPKVIIFFEDIVRLRKHAQQLKLASIGGLTASIAHEIRNPLGAINHAGQLLAEFGELSNENKRLVQIINDHTLRVNTIIENVLSVSRREPASPESFEVAPYLNKFIDELKGRFNLSEQSIKLRLIKTPIKIMVDKSQLHQILCNLCENALRYSKGETLITFYCDIYEDTKRPYIDIIDYGKGVPLENQDKLFEPFFTTETKGSGLGLYLTKEMCEANHIQLELVLSSEKGTIFRLNFMHHSRQTF